MCETTERISAGALDLHAVRVPETEYNEMTKLSMTAMSSEEGVTGLSIR